MHELIADGFARSHIHLALDPTTRRRPTVTGAQDAAYEGAHLVETLPTQVCRMTRPTPIPRGCGGAGTRGEESSDDQAERGMEILRQVHLVNLHERTTQWQQEGWTGAMAHARTAPAPAAATPSPQERPRAPQGGTDDTEVRIPVVHGETSVGTREVERPRAHRQPGHRAPGRGSGALA